MHQIEKLGKDIKINLFFTYEEMHHLDKSSSLIHTGRPDKSCILRVAQLPKAPLTVDLSNQLSRDNSFFLKLSTLEIIKLQPETE